MAASPAAVGSSGAGTAAAAAAAGKTWLQEQVSQRHEPDPRTFS